MSGGEEETKGTIGNNFDGEREILENKEINNYRELDNEKIDILKNTEQYDELIQYIDKYYSTMDQIRTNCFYIMNIISDDRFTGYKSENYYFNLINKYITLFENKKNYIYSNYYKGFYYSNYQSKLDLLYAIDCYFEVIDELLYFNKITIEMTLTCIREIIEINRTVTLNDPILSFNICKKLDKKFKYINEQKILIAISENNFILYEKYKNGYGCKKNLYEGILYLIEYNMFDDICNDKIEKYGNFYYNKKDYKKAFKIYISLSSNSNCLIRIGEMYKYGYSITKDIGFAIKYFKKAMKIEKYPAYDFYLDIIDDGYEIENIPNGEI